MENVNSSRRSFLKKFSLLTAAAATSSVWADDSIFSDVKVARKIGPNEKINLACIGIGNRGEQVINEFVKTRMCNIVALCDTDMGAQHTQKIINKFPDVPRFKKFKDMFDKMGSRIDAVCIATPDHSHFPATMLSMSLGKHVYVEKPLAHSFDEIELLMKAEKKFNVITQMGNQGHSQENYFQFKEWTKEGIIKNVRSVTAHMNNPRRWHKWNPKINRYPIAEEIPSTLDWKEWLSGERYHEYNKDYINGQWRCWYDFGMGALGDWGAHILDTIHEFLELGLPTEINMLRAEGHNPFFFPFSSTIQFHFPERKNMPPLDITWYDGLDNIPEIPKGYGNVVLDPNIPSTNVGSVKPSKLNPGKEIYTDDLTFKGGSHGSILSIIPEEKALDMKNKLPEIPKSPSNHFENFLLSCRGLEKPRSPFSVSGPLSQVFCLGVIAQQLNAKLKFDPKLKMFVNNPIANALLHREVSREGWSELYI